MSEKKNKNSVLVVDDEKSITEMLEIMLSRAGYEVATAGSGKKALQLLRSRPFDVLITDISMPDMNGIELLEKVRQIHHATAVIIMTAHGSTGSAVEAMRLGAADYLTKPFAIEEMQSSVLSALSARDRDSEDRRLRRENGQPPAPIIVGDSPTMRPVFDLIQRVAPTKTNIMILGESGTGKEMVAHAIHRAGGELNAPFVVINCAAVPENLIESELFGHKKGSFTGAIQDHPGMFQQADGGTLFLDEVGDVPLPMQVKLLRAIQQKSFRPVGASADVQISVRIICATNRDLEALVSQGRFREDLFYRLNVIQIRLPPLRERPEDIAPLAEHFLRKFSLLMGKPVKSISSEAMRRLSAYSFPGNVRELENIIERAVALEVQSAISAESLPQKLLMAPSIATTTTPVAGAFDLEKGVEEFERRHILRALEETKGIKKHAAKLLGISFRSLRYRIEKYRIEDPNPDESE